MNTKTVTVGNLTFTVRGKETIGIYGTLDEMERHLGKEAKDFGYVADAFVTADYGTLALDYPKSEDDTQPAVTFSEQEGELIEYFSKRNGSITHNWELSQNLLTIDALRLWSKAVQSTRAPLSEEKKEN